MAFLQEIYEGLRSFWVLWLFALFAAVVIWAFWPSRKQQMEEHGRIPLRDEERNEV